jgi:lysophospholipase L1-like esterase
VTLIEGIALAAGLAGLACLLAELIARALLRTRGDYWVWAPYRHIEMEVDRETLPSLEPRVRFMVNRDGERGDEPPARWDDTMRILLAGGSAAESYLLDQPSSWAQVVQRQLCQPANLARLGVGHVHVGNIARSLVACEYITEMFRRVLPRYQRLDVVLLMVGASDVVNWLEKKTPEALERGKLQTSAIFAEHPEGPFGWRPRTLALRRVVARFVQRFRRPIERKQAAGTTIAKNRKMRANAKELLDTIPDPTPMLEYFEEFFEQMIGLARAKGARVIVVRQPCFAKEFTPEEQAVMWNFGAGRPYVEEVTTYFTHAVVSDLMRRVDEVAVRVAEKLEVEHLDLMPILERDLETYYDFLHFTPKGAEDVGRAVAAKILESSD